MCSASNSSNLEKRVLRRVTIPALLVAMVLIFPPKARSDHAVLSDRVDSSSLTRESNRRTLFDLDKKIVLDFIEIIRFNAHFHEEANRQWWWRDWLYPIEKEAASGLTFANSIVAIKQRASGMENTDLVSKTALRKGYDCDITGHAIGGS